MIDRNDPGKKDEIELEILCAENDEMVNFVFEDVYWARMNLNFGIVANESISQGYLLQNNDEDLKNFYLGWKGLMNDIKLNVYEIVLSSTGGKIKIIAKGFRVDEI